MVQAFCQGIIDTLSPSLESCNTCKDALWVKAAELTLEAYRRPERVAWVNNWLPPEIVQLFDLIPFFNEIFVALMAMSGTVHEAIDEGERYTLSKDTCPFHRATLGNLAAFPAPAVLMGSSHNCNGRDKLLQIVAQEYGRPYFLIDVPNYLNPQVEGYLARQLEKLFRDLEGLFGEVDRSRTKEVFAYSNQTRANLARANELRRHVPAPYTSRSGMLVIYVLRFFWGTPESVQLSEQLCRELEGIIARQAFPVHPELHRLLQMGAPPLYPTPIFDYLEKERGVSLVFEETSPIHWPPLEAADPFGSMARQVFYGAYGLEPLMQRRAARALQLARDYRVDGVLHGSPWGCRQLNGGTVILKDFFAQHGLPFLNLDFDLVDSRNFSFPTIEEQLDGFLEMLEDL